MNSDLDVLVEQLQVQFSECKFINVLKIKFYFFLLYILSGLKKKSLLLICEFKTTTHSMCILHFGMGIMKSLFKKCKVVLKFMNCTAIIFQI